LFIYTGLGSYELCQLTLIPLQFAGCESGRLCTYQCNGTFDKNNTCTLPENIKFICIRCETVRNGRPSRFWLFLKLVQINLIFSGNVHVLSKEIGTVALRYTRHALLGGGAVRGHIEFEMYKYACTDVRWLKKDFKSLPRINPSASFKIISFGFPRFSICLSFSLKFVSATSLKPFQRCWFRKTLSLWCLGFNFALNFRIFYFFWKWRRRTCLITKHRHIIRDDLQYTHIK